MDPAPAAATKPALELESVAAVLADPTRWRILAELAKDGPLPVIELARRTGMRPSNISKHCALLRDRGLIQRNGFSQDYRIVESLRVPGERAIDLGWALVRLNIA